MAGPSCHVAADADAGERGLRLEHLWWSELLLLPSWSDVAS